MNTCAIQKSASGNVVFQIEGMLLAQCLRFCMSDVEVSDVQDEGLAAPNFKLICSNVGKKQILKQPMHDT